MKVTLSQPSYAVRDASEIAFGLLVLGIVLMPVALGLGFALGLLIAMVWPVEQQAAAVVPVCSLLIWCTLVWLVIRRYQKAAAQWGEERRGNSMIHLVEWITVLLGLAFSWAAREGPNEGLAIIRTFLAALMLLLLLSHIMTYCLLRYRPRMKELVTWTVLTGALLIELSRI